MSPSFSSKNGVRYRFYVSAALRGRKHKAGSVSRVSSPEIEAMVNEAVRQNSKDQGSAGQTLISRVERVVISENRVHIALKPRQPG